MVSEKKVRRRIEQALANRDGIELPATMGDSSGVISTGTQNMVWVSLSNGQAIKVFNQIAPTNLPGLKVMIGRAKGQSYWHIVRARDLYSAPPPAPLPSHDDSHRHLYIYRDQIVPLLVLPVSGLTVRVMGAVVILGDTWALVDNQDIDLTASLPTAGARYVLLQYDATGTVTTVDGGLGTKETLGMSNVPAASAGCVPFCAVRMYDSQTELVYLDDFVYPFAVTGGKATWVVSMDDLTDVTISTPTDGQVLRYDAYAEEWINANVPVHLLDDIADVDAPAPSDGQVLVYDIYTDTWIPLDGLFDSPSDGKIYARQDGAWVIISTDDAYTTTNVTPDRSFDADSTSTDELADVLGTLIADLKAKGLIG